MNYYNPYSQPYPTPNTAYGGNYASQMAQSQPQPQMKTNKVYVTSLEDALGRWAEPNTLIVYRNQDEKTEYEIITDAQGKKSYKTLTLSDYSATQTNAPAKVETVSMEQFSSLEKRIASLENEILSKYKKGIVEDE